MKLDISLNFFTYYEWLNSNKFNFQLNLHDTQVEYLNAIYYT